MATKAPSSKTVQARETFSGDLVRPGEDENGDPIREPFVVRKGETFTDDHEIVQAHPSFFEPARAQHGGASSWVAPEDVVFSD